MGRGNVCVHGKFEGLYYIDNDTYTVMERDDEYDEYPEHVLRKDLDDWAGWHEDEVGTMLELEDVLECFMSSFCAMFHSFERVFPERWIKDGPCGDYYRRAIMENGLFYIAIEDNEWSLAVELVQKDDPYDDHLSGLQSRHFQRYLDGIKTCLLERLPHICTRGGPWTSGVIRKSEEGV